MMSDKETRRRLASLIVEALEVGTGKSERDVIDDLFALFGLDFAALDRKLTQRSTALLRASAAEQLADAAPTTAVLLNAVVRCGGRFVAMVEDIYQRLERHAATTTGTSEAFRLRRAGVDEDQLTISPAFLEQVRRLTRRLTTIEVGRIDVLAVGSFVGWDGGELYGRWPPDAANGDRLADHILSLGWIASAVAGHATSSAVRAAATEAVDAATRAAERVVSAAEWLVRAHLARLDASSDQGGGGDDGVRTADVFTDETRNGSADWQEHQLAVEVRRYRNSGMLAAPAASEYVNGIDEPTYLGLDRQLEPVRVPAPDWTGSGTGMGLLAGFIAQWRGGHWSVRSREQLEPVLFSDLRQLTDWLAVLTSQCDAAAKWLATEVFHPTASVDVTALLESVEEFLNLPLWRQRHLLYEVWVLCTTLDACEQAGWQVRLAGTAGGDGVWELSVGATDEPVGQLTRQLPSPSHLDVWHEPRRTTPAGVLTPDVTVTTPIPHARELVVVEAKDRQRMPVRPRRRGERNIGAQGKDQRHALSVAERYAVALRPAVTWVVNHCDYRYAIDPLDEHGTVWARVRLAARFRPGNVPAAFTDTIRAAVTPPDDVVLGAGLLLVVDKTGSMTGKLSTARSRLLNGPLGTAFDQFRAIAYADHGNGEPFLIRAIGPSADLIDVLDAVDALPPASGGDVDEALEDALQRCRELVADVGPQTILILTDAPAHPADACPYRIDAGDEARALLDDGCRILVADDWLRPADQTWDSVVGRPGFERAPLDTITARLNDPRRK